MLAPVLDIHQTLQEEEYTLPYHWFWTPDSEAGRSYFSYLSRVVELIPHTAQTLLDVGCGDGRATAYLAERCPHLQIEGMDYSERALEHARILGKSNIIQWRLSNLYGDTHQESEVFNVITAIEVIEHIPPEELAASLRRIREYLQEDGYLIVTTPSTLMPRPKKHFQHFTPATLRQVMNDAGFKIIVIEGQERMNHIFFFIYKLVDNRWWSIKPFMRWLNNSAYPRWVSPSDPYQARRLIVVATPENKNPPHADEGE